MRLQVLVLVIGWCSIAVGRNPWVLRVVDDSSRGADGVRLGDINGDGLFDIATGWEEGGQTRIYLNPGNGKARSAWPRVTVGPTKSAEDAMFMDVDGDGRLDVVSCCEGKRRAILVHWGPAGGRLLDAEAWKQDELPAAKDMMMWMFAIGVDVDGDGDQDLVAGGKNANAAIGWFERPGDGRDLARWRWHKMSDVGWIMSIVADDMDGDGDEDIVISDRRGPLRGCRWLENPGSGDALRRPWVSHAIGGMGREVMFLRPADLDKDGLEDVLVAVKKAQVLLFRRLDKSGLRWAESSTDYPSNMGTAKAVAVGDIDLDGKNDVVITCEEASEGKSGVRWLSWADSPWHGRWTGHEISGPDGIKYDRIELVDPDGDGDLDVLTTEERQQKRGLGVIWYENPTK